MPTSKVEYVTVLRVKTKPPESQTRTAVLSNKEYPLDRITRLLDFVATRESVINLTTIFGEQFPFAPEDYSSFSAMLEPKADHVKPRGPTLCDGEGQ